MKKTGWKDGQGILEFIIIFVVVTASLIFSAMNFLKPSVHKMYADAGSTLNDSGDLFSNMIGNLENASDVYGGGYGSGGISSGGSGGGFGTGGSSGGWGGGGDTGGGGFGGGSGPGGGSGGISGGSGGSGGSSGGSSGSGSGGASGGGSGGGAGQVINSNLVTALNILTGSSYGKSFGELITQMGISLIYGSMESGTLAMWESWKNTITVNSLLKTVYSEKAIAAVIGHEATHADYNYNYQKWIDSTLQAHPELTADQLHIITYPYDSIDQEYNAFATSSRVWQEVRGSESNPQLDAVLNSYLQGESFMKGVLRQTYAGEPSVTNPETGALVEY